MRDGALVSLDGLRGRYVLGYYRHATRYPGDFPDASEKILRDLRHEETWAKTYYNTQRELKRR